jgi:hypothetical protein
MDTSVWYYAYTRATIPCTLTLFMDCSLNNIFAYIYLEEAWCHLIRMLSSTHKLEKSKEILPSPKKSENACLHQRSQKSGEDPTYLIKSKESRGTKRRTYNLSILARLWVRVKPLSQVAPHEFTVTTSLHMLIGGLTTNDYYSASAMCLMCFLGALHGHSEDGSRRLLPNPSKSNPKVRKEGRQEEERKPKYNP